MCTIHRNHDCASSHRGGGWWVRACVRACVQVHADSDWWHRAVSLQRPQAGCSNTSHVGACGCRQRACTCAHSPAPLHLTARSRSICDERTRREKQRARLFTGGMTALLQCFKALFRWGGARARQARAALKAAGAQPSQRDMRAWTPRHAIDTEHCTVGGLSLGLGWDPAPRGEGGVPHRAGATAGGKQRPFTWVEWNRGAALLLEVAAQLLRLSSMPGARSMHDEEQSSGADGGSAPAPRW